MASSADRRVMPVADPSAQGGPLKGPPSPNLFAPVSTANRITGNTRTHRRREPSQLTPGSQYDYGRDEYAQTPLSPALDVLGTRKSVPPTFLRRTLAESTPPDPLGAGMPWRAALASPEMLLGAYAQAEAPACRPDFTAQGAESLLGGSRTQGAPYESGVPLTEAFARDEAAAKGPFGGYAGAYAYAQAPLGPAQPEAQPPYAGEGDTRVFTAIRLGHAQRAPQASDPGDGKPYGYAPSPLSVVGPAPQPDPTRDGERYGQARSPGAGGPALRTDEMANETDPYRYIPLPSNAGHAAPQRNHPISAGNPYGYAPSPLGVSSAAQQPKPTTGEGDPYGFAPSPPGMGEAAPQTRYTREASRYAQAPSPLSEGEPVPRPGYAASEGTLYAYAPPPLGMGRAAPQPIETIEGDPYGDTPSPADEPDVILPPLYGAQPGRYGDAPLAGTGVAAAADWQTTAAGAFATGGLFASPARTPEGQPQWEQPAASIGPTAGVNPGADAQEGPPRHGRRAALGQTPTDSAAQGYVPRHGGRAAAPAPQPPLPDLLVAQAPPPPPMQTADQVWEAMGWKTPEPDTAFNTAVWRVSDLSMFERAAFDEPPDPFRDPPMTTSAYGEGGPVPAPSDGYAPAYPALADAFASAYPPLADGYAPAYPASADGFAGTYLAPADGYAAAYPQPAMDSVPYPAYEAPPEWAARQPVGPPQPGPEPFGDEPAPAGGHRAGRRADRLKPPPVKSMGPVRTAVIIAVSVGLLFCLIEGVKMARSLLASERDNVDILQEYQALGGAADATAAANGVQLLPAGVTFTPTATPQPQLTPTPEPRIAQNDPLIGVVDGGGASATGFQAALPTATPVTRTRLTQYPNNTLQIIDPSFDTLRQENRDVVGRLSIPGVLEETLVQRNNTFYLNHNARGQVGENSGAVFVDESCVLTVPPENLLVRGQANDAARLLGPLLQYQTGGKEFVTQHGIITCDTIYEKAQYVVFAILRADSVTTSADYFNYAGYPTFQSDALMLRYVEAARSKSLYPITVGVRASDRLLTLATLPEGGDTTCLVLLCRMLRNGEAPGNIQKN